MYRFGFNDHDFDDIKSFFTTQRLYVLVLTYVISMLHMFFDFLAFKSDVGTVSCTKYSCILDTSQGCTLNVALQASELLSMKSFILRPSHKYAGFYRTKTNFAGISSRSLISNFICQLIVYLYLVDNEYTSTVVLTSSGISTLIELWKIKRILKVTVEWKGLLPMVVNKSTSSAEDETDQFDRTAMRWLNIILYPLVVASAVWSLIHHPHKSWWSWAISGLAHCVYTFGFIMVVYRAYLRLLPCSHSCFISYSIDT